MITETQETPVLATIEGRLGRIRLNRPKVLNSLTADMIGLIEAALDRFEADPKVAAVLISGEGERGLCAGGDIRALYDSGKAGDGKALEFLRQEYALNARIAKFPKPYVAFMDGITMGGGVGVSAHGSVRIVTERTRLAMPETGIGFFPDIGGTWLLTRAPGEVGTYLGLTGEQINGADAIYTGLADVFMPSGAFGALVAALSTLPAKAGLADVRATVAAFTEPPPPASLQSARAQIDACFKHDHAELIFAALAAAGSEFSQKTLASLRTKSPTSVKVALRLLRLGRRSATLEDCLRRELFGARKILAGTEFYEGVRAAVIDKDRNPKWSPAALADVSDTVIETYLDGEKLAL